METWFEVLEIHEVNMRLNPDNIIIVFKYNLVKFRFFCNKQKQVYKRY